MIYNVKSACEARVDMVTDMIKWTLTERVVLSG